MRVVLYEPQYKALWDGFVQRSKNGVFLFYRDYMEYHAERFTDHSLLFFDGPRLLAIMPANRVNDQLVSHGGLTFGGIVSDDEMKMPLMSEVFRALVEYVGPLGVKRILYKAIPHIYHRIPAEEDLYTLFALGARLYRRDVSSTILLSAPLGFTKGRRGCIKKGQAQGVTVRKSEDFDTFMAIDEAHMLRKHNKKPVHTAAELKLLASRFPEYIKLFGAYRGETMVGGVLIYESREVAHAQYIAATDEGKALGALDVVLAFLIQEYYRGVKHFDFGISTDRDGRYLDVGLVSNKESFGARTTVYDFYEIPVA